MPEDAKAEEPSWYWQDIGGDNNLVLFRQDRTRTVVLMASDKARSYPGGRPITALVTRMEDGLLRPMGATHPVAKMISAVPDLIEACRAMYRAHGNCGSPMEQSAADRVVAALEKAGVPLR